MISTPAQPQDQNKPLAIIWRDQAHPATYEEARTRNLFNAQSPRRFPIAVVLVQNTSDIVRTVKLAIEKGCRISVRAGGHSYAGWSVRDDAILVDLGGLSKDPIFDDNTGIVRVTPNTTGQELASYLAGRNRFFTVGHCPGVGLGGFLLGGGMGWNCNNWGWACEQVKAIDVVTANGSLLHADAQQNSDLFWAARGAGPAVPGLVSHFHLQTRPASKWMFSSGYVYPMRHYKTAINWALKISSYLNDSLEIVAVGSYYPDIEEPCIMVALTAYGDQEYLLRDVLQRIEESHPEGKVAHWFCEETSIQQELDKKDRAFPHGHRYFVENAWLQNDADVAAVLETAFTALPTKNSMVLWQSMVPCSRRKLPEMALSMQSDHYFAFYGIWEDENDDHHCQSVISEIMSKVEKYSVGSYLGELDFRVRESKYWQKSQQTRILEIRRKWDPEGRICGCLGLEEMDNHEGKHV
ncbi:hypothetical protein N7523_003675 [Penicillium sp. IBT 18751x]|nr:hypothetical protein N7523_003675 [Penicillium sp. IBT 18751x]